MERKAPDRVEDVDRGTATGEGPGGTTGRASPGGGVDRDGVMTSSGVSPTGGVPAGGAGDRIQPDRTIFRGAEGGNRDRSPEEEKKAA
jgi:hypothetical protein